MATHLNEVGSEAKKIFADVRIIGRRVLDRFYEGFEKALKDVHKGWKQLKPRERKVVFETVQKVAKQIIVSEKDGGGASEEDGLSLGTFNGYVCKIKRALVYNVPLYVAEHATHQDLQRAQKYVTEVLSDTSGSQSNKMIKGYEWVKQEQIKEKSRLREEAAKASKPASAETPFTLPNPDDYELSDSETLLNDGLNGILHWLQTKSLKQHLRKNLPAAKVLKSILGEISSFAPEPEAAVA